LVLGCTGRPPIYVRVMAERDRAVARWRWYAAQAFEFRGWFVADTQTAASMCRFECCMEAKIR
jgi:hypothetical protein